ncbi:hypothetical protein QTP88_002849 [Uroleucon formosanum]
MTILVALLCLQEIDEEQAIIHHRLSKKSKQTHTNFKARESEGFFSILIEKHLWEDQTKFREFFRLSWNQFNYVLNLIEDDITSNPTNKIKKPISPAEKLVVTSRSLAFAFRISQSYLTRIMRMALQSLSTHLTPILLKMPTKNDLIQIPEEFWRGWNFPNCVGAIDG